MSLSDVLGIVFLLGVGVFAGWLLGRSRFSLLRVFRNFSGTGASEATKAYLLSISLIWFALGVVSLKWWGEAGNVPAVGIPAAMLAGFLSGAAMALLGRCPLTLVLDTGGMSQKAMTGFAGWVLGMLIALHGPLSPFMEALQDAGFPDFGGMILSGFTGIPRWLLFIGAGVLLLAWLLRMPVSVRPAVLDWPKTGLGLAVLILASWVFTLQGGDIKGEPVSGLNAVIAVEDVWRGVIHGDMWLRPTILVVLGIMGWGFYRAFRSRRIFADPASPPAEYLVTLGAGFLLGLASVMGKGSVVSHAFFGGGVLGISSLFFLVSVMAGVSVMGSGRGEEFLTRRDDLVRRIWNRDPTVWHHEASHRGEIVRRLGWLEVAAKTRKEAMGLAIFARDAVMDGFTGAVLLGMGGSSLAPEVIRRVLGRGKGGLDLRVLDTTDPAEISRTAREMDPGKTLVLVASKSGTTIEIDSLMRHFWKLYGADGRRFAAITDPGTALDKLGRERKFRRVFLNPPDIGGRYSALSLFGMVPATLAGLDASELLDRGAAMAEECRPRLSYERNPGLTLGISLADAWLSGRDKVTFITSPGLESFGLWAEQLLAESTGKEGRGLVPVAGEPIGSPESYSADRLFISMSIPGAENEDTENFLSAVQRLRHPVVRIKMRDHYDLGGEFFRWEFATAVAGAVMEIDPFDQPNVQEAKDRTKALLKELEEKGSLPEPPAGEPEKAARQALRSLKSGVDYAAILAFLPMESGIEARLQKLRSEIRDRFRVATTLGFGPRYLHSTGQLHKGGGTNGVFIIITCGHPEDLPVPDAAYTFGQLERAQALGDLDALAAKGLRVVRFHVESPEESRVAEVCDRIRSCM